jgi:hypothetical protein
MEEHAIQSKINGITGKRQEAFYYLSFLVWPFGVLLAALRHWDKSWSKNVFWMFCIFFGFTIIILKEGSNDCDHYARRLIEFSRSDFSLKEFSSSLYSESSGFVDIVVPMIIYLLSRITHNPSILFALFGLISGYFYSRNIWYVLDQIKGKITGIVLIYIITFVLLYPIWRIGNLRLFLATHVFLFGTLPYLLEGNNKRLIWSAVSVFVHFTFIFPFAILLMFIILKNKLNIYFVFFIITAFIKELDLEWVRYVLSFVPGIFSERFSSYTNIEYAEEIRNQNQLANWYITYSVIGLKWVVYAFILYVYFFRKSILKDFPRLTTLLCFSLLCYGWSNILSNVPSGARFITISNTFVFPFFILFMTLSPKLKGALLLKILTLPALLLYCIVEVRTGMDFYGLTTIIGNPLFAILNTETVPLITGIKKLFLLRGI